MPFCPAAPDLMMACGAAGGILVGISTTITPCLPCVSDWKHGYDKQKSEDASSPMSNWVASVQYYFADNVERMLHFFQKCTRHVLLWYQIIHEQDVSSLVYLIALYLRYLQSMDI